jgi:hypothetical protein
VYKIPPPPGFDPQTVRPAGNSYTDSAVAEHNEIATLKYNTRERERERERDRNVNVRQNV